ncbi:Uncharacterised protein [Streptococcus pneumoniae]|nr:Uncharacterised protein [Streptococcus pneumoniae]
MLFNIKLPIIISIGATAPSGIIFIKGIKKNEMRNNKPTKIEDKPVFAPAAIPTALSKPATVELVPKTPAKMFDIPVA